MELLWPTFALLLVFAIAIALSTHLRRMDRQLRQGEISLTRERLIDTAVNVMVGSLVMGVLIESTNPFYGVITIISIGGGVYTLGFFFLRWRRFMD